jgi:hypothetical protein
VPHLARRFFLAPLVNAARRRVGANEIMFEDRLEVALLPDLP